MSRRLLEIQDLHVQYCTADDTVHALNGLDLTVDKGETLGLVGETGAGKTTMALSVLKLLPYKIGAITGGSIRLEGREIVSTPERQMKRIRGAQVSMIFQDPMTSLNPAKRIGPQIAENLILHQRDLSKRQVRDKVAEMLRLVGISAERGDDFPHQLSGGMRQRVVIAIALACEPKLILADEPTTALDVTIQAQVLGMMRELKDRLDTAMLLITHDLGVVAENCDRVAIIYAGEIIETGDVGDIFEGAHHHPYTEGLFGSIPDLTRKTRRLSPVAGMMPDPTNLPPGCCFQCVHCMDLCRAEKPIAVCEGSHAIKCHRFRQGLQPVGVAVAREA